MDRFSGNCCPVLANLKKTETKSIPKAERAFRSKARNKKEHNFGPGVLAGRLVSVLEQQQKTMRGVTFFKLGSAQCCHRYRFRVGKNLVEKW